MSVSRPPPDPLLYVPRPARILEILDLTARERYFRFALDRPLGHRPGQFVMIGVPGAGECAISIASPPGPEPVLETVIRRAGNVTGVLHGLEAGAWVGLRGPFGSGFRLEELYGQDLLIVVGGLGLVPLRSLILAVLAEKERFGEVTVIVGARTPAETLFREEQAGWGRQQGVRVIRTVDRTEHQPWDGEVGLVTAPIAALGLDPGRTAVILCGPPVMYKFVLLELDTHHRIPAGRIYLDLERRMKCGVGKCGHCQIDQVYCCTDGPVFRYAELAGLPEALA